MYLVDTSLWLELLLEQDESRQVREFLENSESNILYISEFALYSIGVVLLRLKKAELFLRFVKDISDAGINIIRLLPRDMEALAEASGNYNLDFDDAYQYVAAEKYDLEILSFDGDFDRTERGRKTPDQVRV